MSTIVQWSNREESRDAGGVRIIKEKNTAFFFLRRNKKAGKVWV